MTTDLWGTEKGTYSIDRFYTRSKDKQGHSTLFHVKVPDDLAGALSSIVQSGRIPDYRTVQDIFRDGLVHRLHWITENIANLNIPQIQSILARMAMENDTIQYQEELAAYDDLLQRVENCCAAAAKMGDFDYLRDYIDHQRDMAEYAREPFRSKITAILDEYKARIK